MFERWIKNREIRLIVLFALISLMGYALDLLVFTFGVRTFGVSRGVANLLSFHAAMFFGFFYNTIYNFKKTDRRIQRFICFYAFDIAGSVLCAAIQWAGKSVIPPALLNPGAMLLSTALQYVLNRFVTYNKFEPRNS